MRLSGIPPVAYRRRGSALQSRSSKCLSPQPCAVRFQCFTKASWLTFSIVSKGDMALHSVPLLARCQVPPQK